MKRFGSIYFSTIYSYVPVVLSSEAFISQRLSSADSFFRFACQRHLRLSSAVSFSRFFLQTLSSDSHASATLDSPLQIPPDSFCRLFLQILSVDYFSRFAYHPCEASQRQSAAPPLATSSSGSLQPLATETFIPPSRTLSRTVVSCSPTP